MRILITTDGLPHSDPALILGSLLGASTSTRPTLLHVIRREHERSMVEDRLARALALLPDPLSDLPTQVAIGTPREQIVRVAREGNYDLILMGFRPRTGLAIPRHETAAEWVLRHGPCSVIVAKGDAKLPEHILICDSGADSPHLMAQFKQLAADWLPEGAKLTVLHVMSQISAHPGVPGWQLRADAEQLIEAHTPEGQALEIDEHLLEQDRLNAETIVRHGLVVEEILEESKAGDYDLIVIGEHPPESWRRLLLEDIAHEIIVGADRPVMVLKKPAENASPAAPAAANI